ncbi:MAG: hypothetical protein N3A53_02075 [Verrucomicrobiae bacterium]|nr:hypothetical protein [Verrucomicrobiae bacterium]
MKMVTWDDVRVVIASATGISAQLADIDVIIKIMVGVVTIIYISCKTVKLIKGNKETED